MTINIDYVESPIPDVGGLRNPLNQDTYELGDDNPLVIVQPDTPPTVSE